MKFTNTFSNISIVTILAVSMCCSGAKTYAEEPKWDFEYGFKHLNEVGADKYVVENKNLRKYTEWQNPPITYLGPKSNDDDCSLTRKFTFDRPTSATRLKVNLATYNFGGGSVGKASCWASIDGKDWKLVLDNPTPSRIDSYKGFDDDLPSELTGSKELWVQMRLHVSKAPNSSYTLAQFGRSTANAKNNVFEIKAALKTAEKKKSTDFTLSDATVEENKPEGTVVGSFYADSLDKGNGSLNSSLGMSRHILAAGDLHTVFIKEDGSLWGMGSNNYGQLGDRAESEQLTPVKIVDGGVVAVAAGHYHTHFVKNDGSLWGMGRNLFGALGDGTTTNRTSPGQILSSGVYSVAAGVWHSLILKTDGTLLASGYNPYGQLGVGDGGGSEQNFTSGIDRVLPTQVLDGMQVISMAGGRFHSAFVKSDGSLWTTGRNWAGQLGNGSTSFYKSNGTPSKVVSAGVATVTTGRDHTLFTKTDGSLWGMGRNNYGQLGDGTSGGAFEGYDGGIDKKTPAKILDANVTKVSAGYQHSLFLMEDGSLWGMGLNDKGQLGDGSNTNSVTPKRIIDADVLAIVAGKNHRGGGHSLFVKKDGTLWSMGENSYGQLGIGSKFDVKTPVQVTSLRVLEKKNFTFSLVDGNGSQDNKLFTIDANGALKTTVSFDFETKSSHSIRVQATDENNGTVEKIFVISVTDVAENAAPVFTSSPTAFTRENETFAIDANASDPDGDALTFSLTGGEDREQFTINAATGALNFRSAPDFENPADADGNNVYLVELSVSDGKLTASQLLAATVTDMNEDTVNPPTPPDHTAPPPPPPVDDRPKDPLPPKPTPEPTPEPEPTPTPRPIDLRAGLLAHYPYTGNANDHSGNEHHLEVNGSTPTGDRFGMPNSAYAFDGKGDFMFADIDERKGDFSLSLWAKADDVEQSRYRSVINVFDKTPGSKHTCQIHTSGGRYPTYQFFSSNPESFALVTTEWQHLAVTVSGKVIRFYENGNRVYSQELEGGEANKFSNIIIGRNRHGGAKYHGAIDDVYVYNRAITDAEVERLFNGGFEDTDGDGLTDDYEVGHRIQNGESTNIRYQIISDKKYTFREAEADAEQRGGHLATIVSEEEHKAVMNAFGGKLPHHVWIGGSDENTEGAWEWVTGELWKFAKWDNGQPESKKFNGAEDFSKMYVSGVWHDWRNQERNEYYLLEYGYYTDPTLADSDGDRVNDGVEVAAKTDPNNPLSRPAPDRDAPGAPPSAPPGPDYVKKIEELTKDNAAKAVRIEDLETAEKAHLATIADLNATNASLAATVEKQKKTIANLNAENIDLKQQLNNTRQEVVNVSYELTETKEQLQAAIDVARTPFVNGWVYDPQQGWLFTDADHYPLVYSHSTESWHYYELGTADPRFFYSYKTQEWEAWDPMPEQTVTAAVSSQGQK